MRFLAATLCMLVPFSSLALDPGVPTPLYDATRPNGVFLDEPRLSGDGSGITVRAPAGQSARSLLSFAGDRINPIAFRAPGDPANDWSAAFQRAVDAAIAQGKQLYLPGGINFELKSTVLIRKPISIVGDGEAVSSVTGKDLNGPIFRINTTAATGENLKTFVGGFTIGLSIDATADYRASRGFLIDGDTSTYFQYARFQNITSQGLYSTFEIAKGGTHADWTSFDNITILSGAKGGKHGWMFPLGSGTGFSFTNLKSSLQEEEASLIYFGVDLAAPQNVGDVVFLGGHLGGRPGTAVIEFAKGATYRANISIVGSQLDAGMDVPFKFDPSDAVYERMLFSANNVGGNLVTIGAHTPYLRHSIIDDQLVSMWRAGSFKEFAARGSQTVPLFSVSVPAYDGSEVDVSVSGVVGGLSGGISRATYLVSRQGEAAVATLVSQASSAKDSGFFAIRATARDDTITFSTTFTAPIPGSRVQGQIRATGGTFRLRRL